MFQRRDNDVADCLMIGVSLIGRELIGWSRPIRAAYDSNFRPQGERW